MPNAETRPLFDLAEELGVGFYLGYAELTQEKGETAPLQHRRSWSIRRADRRALSQDPSAGPFRAPAARAVPAPRKALFRCRQRGLPGLALHGRGRRHVHLQRPALARDLPRHGVAGGRDRRARLQHADREHPPPRTRASAHVPPPAVVAGRRLPERDLGAGRGEMRRRGRVRDDRRLGDRRADRRDRGAGA